jgi:DNA-binding PadR family transcriptional regulator
MNKQFSLITTYILLSLVDNNLTGYELIKEVKKHNMILFTGTLYPKLKKLETDNLIIVSGTKITGRQNIRYKITKEGIKYLNNNMKSLEILVLKIKEKLEANNENNKKR